jgi:hypothetical protein
MPDSTVPVSADLAALTASVRRLRTLTYISLGFNALFLALIILGIVSHHHRHHHGFDKDGGGQGCPMAHGGGQGSHHWGGGFGPGHGGWGGNGGPGQGWGGPGGPGGFDDKGPSQGWGGPGGKGPGMMGPNGAPPDPAVMTYFAMAKLTEKLKLTDDQQAKLKPIIQAQITALMKQMDDGKSQVRAALTPDQQKQFDALPFVGNKAAATTSSNTPASGK